MLTLLNRFPSDPTKPHTPAVERWFTALILAVNQLLTGTQVGLGDPEGVITAPQGSIFRRTDGGAGSTVYAKTTGGVDPATLTNTGWVPFA